MGDFINKLLEETELTKLPSLPHVLIKLLNACQKDTACFDSLAEIIDKDAALSAKVLAVANSPVYGRCHQLKSLKQILLFLGMDTIKSIAITASVQQFFSRYSKEKSRFLKGFWEHTLFTAMIAKSLAKLTSYHNPEEAYLAGLLHDIGKLIFENYSQHEYSQLLDTDTSSEELLKRERDKYNITHDEIGARLLEIWGIPDVIGDAIRYHHASTQDIIEAHHLVKIINLANSMTSNDHANLGVQPDYNNRLFDLSDSVLKEILDKARTEVKKIATSLEIDIGDIELHNKDEEKQIQLAQQIRDISLTHASMHVLTEDTNGIDYSAIQKSTMILFGLNKSCLFLYSEDTNTLTLDYSTSKINEDILKGFELKCDSPSLIAETMNSGEPKIYFLDDKDSHQPVIDKQIIHAFKTEGLYCIPLVSERRYVGVIVVGINHEQYNELKNKTSLLNIYASEIAARISSAENGQKIRTNFIKDTQDNIRSKTREIIHEVNNPLAIIRNYLQILGTRLTEDDPAQNDLHIINDEIDRVGSIILKCDKDFDDAETVLLSHEINVNDLIISINTIMESSLYSTHNVTSKLNLSDNLDTIDSNKNSIKQILTNLVKNSVEAMQNQKIITINTRNVNVNGKRFVEVEISDTGPGIPDNILKNIYKPVTSTKGAGHSGLGLSIVKNLLDNAGGVITCKTGNTGTTFSIHFPSKATL